MMTRHEPGMAPLLAEKGDVDAVLQSDRGETPGRLRRLPNGAQRGGHRRRRDLRGCLSGCRIGHPLSHRDLWPGGAGSRVSRPGRLHCGSYGPGLMATFPVDAPKARAVKTLEQQGFRLVREGLHLAMVRQNPDATQTFLIIPNHSDIRGSTLRTLCIQAGIARDEFLKAYEGAGIGAR